MPSSSFSDKLELKLLCQQCGNGFTLDRDDVCPLCGSDDLRIQVCAQGDTYLETFYEGDLGQGRFDRVIDILGTLATTNAFPRSAAAFDRLMAALLTHAEQDFAAGDCDNAVKLSKGILSVLPECLDAQNLAMRAIDSRVADLLAQASRAKGHWKKLTGLCEAVLKYQPDNAQACALLENARMLQVGSLMRRVARRIEAANFEDAIELLREIQSLVPAHAEAGELITEIQRQDNLNAGVEAALSASAAGKTSECIGLCGDLILEQGEDLRASSTDLEGPLANLREITAAKQSQLIEIFTAACKSELSGSQASAVLAALGKLAMGKPVGALSSCAVAEMTDEFLRRVEACATARNWNRALELGQQFLEVVPDSSRALDLTNYARAALVTELFDQARACFERQKWEDAAALCTSTLAILPSHAEAVGMLEKARRLSALECSAKAALAAWDSGNFAECTGLCEEIIRQQGGDYRLVGSGFDGPCVQLRNKAAEKLHELNALVTAMSTAGQRQAWAEVERLAQAILALCPTNTGAKRLRDDARLKQREEARLAHERAEQERLARERAEQERLARERAEREKREAEQREREQREQEARDRLAAAASRRKRLRWAVTMAVVVLVSGWIFNGCHRRHAIRDFEAAAQEGRDTDAAPCAERLANSYQRAKDWQIMREARNVMAGKRQAAEAVQAAKFADTLWRKGLREERDGQDKLANGEYRDATTCFITGGEAFTRASTEANRKVAEAESQALQALQALRAKANAEAKASSQRPR